MQLSNTTSQATADQRSVGPAPRRVVALDRVIDALQRRARYWLSLLRREPHGGMASAALQWLLDAASDDCLPFLVPGRLGCPGATGGALATIWAYGQRDAAYRWARYLVTLQQSDGSWADPRFGGTSLLATAHAARGLLAVADALPQAEDAAFRACCYLNSRFDGRGRLLLPERHSPAEAGKAPANYLGCLPALVDGAGRWSESDWLRAAERALAHHRQDIDLNQTRLPLHGCAWWIEASIALESPAMAAATAKLPMFMQRDDGSIPAASSQDWTCSAALAHLAKLCYRLGRRDHGDRAMRFLARHQNPGGGFFGSWGRGAAYFPRHETTWTVKHLLDAALLQVQACFDEDAHALPREIDPNDGRMQAVRAWMAKLPAEANIADVGCGTGRFLRHLANEFPRTSLVGIDHSAAALEVIPPGVSRLQENLLRLSLPSGTLDGAFAVESIEHALVAQQAVAELCRVVRPGGRVLIIDKYRRKQALSHHEPWEQWFEPAELSRWLKAHCDHVEIRPIPHDEGRHRADLFFAATGWRRR